MFTSEEPTLFGIGCLGSRLIAGVLSPERADTLHNQADETLHEIRTAAGFVGELDSVRLKPGHYKAFVELHIEQGPLLERHGEQIGIVTGIAAPAGYRFVVEGFGGHAGALLMPDRRDALCAAAEIVLSVEKHALATGSIDTVATVGTCDVHPGAVNSVPSRVTLQLDIRDTDPDRRESVMQAVRADIAELAARRNVKITESQVNADQPAACDPALVRLLTDYCQANSIAFRPMVSRAYHDTSFMASICPVTMIFIPCRAGVSHRPDEFAKPEDIARGSQLLAFALAELASE